MNAALYNITEKGIGVKDVFKLSEIVVIIYKPLMLNQTRLTDNADFYTHHIYFNTSHSYGLSTRSNK